MPTPENLQGAQPAGPRSIEDLKADSQWVSRFVAGDRKAAADFDAALGIPSAPAPVKPVEPRNPSQPSPRELDTRTPDQREHSVPPEPTGYRIDYGPGSDLSIPENAKLDSDVRAWLHAAGQTQQDASAHVEILGRDAVKFAGMSDEQWKAAHDDSIQRFNSHFGADADKAMNTARAAIDAIDCAKPGFKDFVAEHGLGASLNLLFAAVRWGREHGL